MVKMHNTRYCRHCRVLPENFCEFCRTSTPQNLLDLCYQNIGKDLENTLCVRHGTDKLRLRDNLALPLEICEGLMKVQERITPEFVHIFDNRYNTKLKRVKLRGSTIEDKDLLILLRHRLYDLDMSHCSKLGCATLISLSHYADCLVSLCIGYEMHIYGEHSDLDEDGLRAPHLRRLVLRGANVADYTFYERILLNTPALTHLDLSDCKELGSMECLEALENLISLVLYNVSGVENMLKSICKLRTLRHLDISQAREMRSGPYEDPNETLAKIVESLPSLTSLDISGTNLAGRGVAESFSEGILTSDIPGLSSRMSNPFQYLGLYETANDACLRHDIPAELIGGNANEEQILIAAMAFLDRSEMLQKVLNELFHLLRFETCVYVGQALHIVLEAMTRHINDRHVQISGSATLFYIVKSNDKELTQNITVKQRIIASLLSAMIFHKNDETMMRNGCLTLCQFKIPDDVLFDYERLVHILLHSVFGMQHESFVQRIGIYLLNSLACQVDGDQKVKLGELGAIERMISLIRDRLDRSQCDDVLEVAWSTMWNVTDETPSNCRIFLDLKGMEYFLQCLENFPNKEELLRNMMGLLGNVAEVQSLRPYLMTDKYLTVFADLLLSNSDGIEVSYNAAGVLAHIASDGPRAWTVTNPSRNTVLERMAKAIDGWDICSQRNINYRSFGPILHLAKIYHTPECQRWAVWALANLTKVYPDKYCGLIEKEGGITLLHEILKDPRPPSAVKRFAGLVIATCQAYKEKKWLEVVGML